MNGTKNPERTNQKRTHKRIFTERRRIEKGRTKLEKKEQVPMTTLHMRTL
jgi:hypothetical protein